MKILIALAAALSLSSSVAGAEQPPKRVAKTVVAAEPSGDSPLVRAARSGPKDRGRAKITITNETVRKTTGKVSELQSEIAPPAEIEPVDTSSAEREKLIQAQKRELAEQKRQEAHDLVLELERELNQLEEDYYNESDPTYRDDVLQRRFDESKSRLDDARRSLSDARDEESRYSDSGASRPEPPPPAPATAEAPDDEADEEPEF